MLPATVRIFSTSPPSVQCATAAQGGGDQFFFIALNVEREVGFDLAAGRGINGCIDGEGQIGGQVNINISHARFELRGAKGLLGAVEFRQNASRRRGSPDGAFDLDQIDAASRGLRHHAAACALQADASTGRLRPHAAAGRSNLNLPARGSGLNLSGGATHYDVPACGLGFQRARHLAGYDFSATGLEGGITFYIGHVDGASRRAGNQVAADLAKLDAAARRFQSAPRP